MPNENKEKKPGFFSRVWTAVMKIAKSIWNSFFGTTFRAICTVICIAFLVFVAIVAWELFLITIISIVGYMIIMGIFMGLFEAGSSVKKAFREEEAKAKMKEHIEDEKATVKATESLKTEIIDLERQKANLMESLARAARAIKEGPVVDAEFCVVL